MKKFLLMALAFVILVSLCACAQGASNGGASTGTGAGGSATQKYDHEAGAVASRNKDSVKPVSYSGFFREGGDSLPEVTQLDFDDRYLADEDVDGTVSKAGKYYEFSEITYSAGMGVTYREALQTADGDVWNELHGLSVYEDKESYLPEFQEYASVVIPMLKATGDFDEVDTFDDINISAKGCDIFAITEDGGTEFSVNADYDGYQCVNFDVYFYRYNADALGSDFDAMFDNIKKYTGILFDIEDFNVLVDVVDRNSVEGGGILARLEDPENFDGVEVSVINYGLQSEMWHVNASREVQKWPAFE